MGGDGTSIEAALHSACNRGSIPGLSSSLRRTRPAQVQENMAATWDVITDERSPSGVGGLMVAGRRSVGGSMRNRIWSGSFAAVIGVAAVTLTAQTTPPSQTTTASSGSDKKITVTGCLQAMPSSAPDTTAAAAGTTAGTAGTTGAAGTAGTAG